MAGRLAILAGQGDLPQILARSVPGAVFVTFAGIDVDVPAGLDHLEAGFERIGTLFAALHERAVDQVVFAGSMARPALDPARFDETMMALAPRLMAAMGQGDDGLLREVASVFEEQGFCVRGAQAVTPDLTLLAGARIGPEPGKGDLADAARAGDILQALAPLDMAQCAVVAGGQVLGVETLQGTDAMLRFVAETPAYLRRTPGVMVKQPKVGQDLRFDMPAIGPQTLRAAAAAGLAGIVIAAEGVLVFDQPAMRQIVRDSGLFVLSR